MDTQRIHGFNGFGFATSNSLTYNPRYNSAVILLIFQGVRQVPTLAQQVAPNVYVTVQPPPGGMPEWVKILLSATVGAFVGIVSNIAMEYMKPWIAKRNLRKTVTGQLVSELAANYSKIESGLRALAKVDETTGSSKKNAMAMAGIILKDIDVDRYEFNFTNNKALVYEIDLNNSLTTVYKALKAARTAYETLDFPLVKVNFEMASLQTQMFFKERSIPLEATETVFDKLAKLKESSSG
jgi:hypothetical protein